MNVKLNHRVTTTATLVLDEVEIRALDAMCGYGYESFMRAFKEKLGKAYLEGYEVGIARLFESIDRVCKPAIAEVDKARKLLAEK